MNVTLPPRIWDTIRDVSLITVSQRNVSGVLVRIHYNLVYESTDANGNTKLCFASAMTEYSTVAFWVLELDVSARTVKVSQTLGN